jgi:hypothetical protein
LTGTRSGKDLLLLLLLLLLVHDVDAVSGYGQTLCLPVGTDGGHGGVCKADVTLLGARAEVRGCCNHDALDDLRSSLQGAVRQVATCRCARCAQSTMQQVSQA